MPEKHNQSKLEEEMVERGKERYYHKIKRAEETSLESTTSVGQYLLAESIAHLDEALVLWLAAASKAPGRRHRAYGFLSQLPTKVVAGLTSRCILDCISIERKITSTATTLGRLLEDELKFRELKDNEPALWNQINRVLDRYKSQKTKSKFINNTARYHEIVLPQWDRKDAASVGLTCIELMRQSTGIIAIKTRTDAHGKSYTIIRPTDDLLKWMKNTHEYNENLSPVWLPMVERPVDWNNPLLGGYQSTSFRRRPLIKTHDKGYLEEVCHTEMPEVYSAVNTLQRTPYKVDGMMLSVLQHCWDKGLPIGGLPSMEDEPILNKPTDIATNEDSRRAWRKSAARTHFENERQKSKRLQVMKVLNLGEKFKNDTLFFPHNFDFRARTYPIPYFLQPQGPPWSKSLLRFGSGVSMDEEGVKGLYIHAANKWGVDKEPYPERLKWTEGNIELVRRIGADPLSEMTWSDADDPWGFLAACLEIQRFHSTGSSYSTTLPCAMDATTQGLQIYAMLLRDPVAGLATNILPTEVPADVYQSVADIVRRKLYEDESKYGAGWLTFGISRKTTKRQTMTVCYSSTFYSCKAYTAEWFYEELKSGRDNPFGEETYKPCNYLAEIIWESIGEVVASARVGMDWLKKCAGVLLENDVTPRWYTPLGFPVKMHYENTDKYTIKTLVSGVLRQHRLRIPNGEANRRKTLNAMCPNYIHSLDGIGGLLGDTINRGMAAGIKQIMSVHDSLSVPAPQLSMMQRCVRESTVEMFDKNPLENLAFQLTTLLPPEASLPTLPQFGSLNIAEVLRSKYYWN